MRANRDRWGEVVDLDDEDDVDQAGEHDAKCVGGWRPDAADGRPRACPRCRPWVAERRAHLVQLLHGPAPRPCTPTHRPREDHHR